MKTLGPTDLKRLHREWRRRTDLRLAMILDGVQKPYNVGGLLRSAAAYKTETVWAVPPTPSPAERSVAKIALGSERLLEWVDVPTGVAAVRAAKEAGFITVAIELTATAKPLFELDLTGSKAAAGSGGTGPTSSGLSSAGLSTGAIDIGSEAVTPAICLVLGHEERGVHKDTLDVVDHIGYLPQLGKIGSLNVAQAGTVALYEVARQSWS